MAKYGEGDKRWIVEERSDGTNVHNWHWAETNCLDWSRKLFTTLLEDLTILNGEGDLFIKITKVQKVDGEAYVNIRKGKIIPGYEISLSLDWQGEFKDSDGNIISSTDGTVDIPYIADENAGEDPEVKITVKDEGPVGHRLKEAFIARGKPLVLEKVGVYVESMAKGGPAKEELELKKPKKDVLPAQHADEVARMKKETKEEGPKSKKGFRSITLTETFSCRAKDIYDILMDENRWKGFTQSNAKISKDVGGEFSIFDGSVTGVHLALEDAKMIIQRWRFTSWEEGIYSTVKLTFDESRPGVTIVKLNQTDLPEEDRYGNATVVENTERGWRDLIFHKIRALFGFGI